MITYLRYAILSAKLVCTAFYIYWLIHLLLFDVFKHNDIVLILFLNDFTYDVVVQILVPKRLNRKIVITIRCSLYKNLGDSYFIPMGMHGHEGTVEALDLVKFENICIAKSAYTGAVLVVGVISNVALLKYG